MRKLIGSAFVSLDGVMQAPGGPSEDWTGDFTKGGWLPAVTDAVIREAIDRLFGTPFDLLLGRRTYDIFAAYWPYAEGEEKPLGELLNRASKYVLTHVERPLGWQNSYRLESIEAVAQLKRGEGPDLIIQGSSTLYPQLLAAGLLDRLTLMTFPVVLGHGKRLFGEGASPQAMKLVDHRVSPRGNIIATYEPAGEVAIGSFVTAPESDRERARQKEMSAGTW